MGKRLFASLSVACAILTIAQAQTSTNLGLGAPAPLDTNLPLTTTLPETTNFPAAPAPLPAETVMPVATATNAPAPKPKKPKPVNVISGKVSSIDKTNLTVTVEGKKKSHTYAVTSATRFTKMGKPATFTEVSVGEEVHGTFAKVKGGGERIVALELNAKAPKAAAHKPTHKKAKTTKKVESKPLEEPAAIPTPVPLESAPAPASTNSALLPR